MTGLARTASTPTLTQSVTLRRFLATVLSAILDGPQALPDFHQNRETRVLAHELVYLFAAPSPHVLSPIIFEWSVGGPFSDAVATLLRDMAEDQTCATVNAEDHALTPEAQRSIAIVRDLLARAPARAPRRPLGAAARLAAFHRPLPRCVRRAPGAAVRRSGCGGGRVVGATTVHGG